MKFDVFGKKESKWKKKLYKGYFIGIFSAALVMGLLFSWREGTAGFYFMFLALAMVVEHYYLQSVKRRGDKE